MSSIVPILSWLTKSRVPGARRLAAAVFPPLPYASRHAELELRRNDGLRMWLDTRHHIEWEVAFAGAFEPRIGELLRGRAAAGSTAIDVGANIGVHTLTMAEIVGPHGRVIALEPNPGARERLMRNLRINGLQDRVTVVGSAAGDAPGRAVLHVPSASHVTGGNVGIASLAGLETPHDEVDVEVVTLDGLLSGQSIPRVSLVKIDTQGFDAKVLRGMGRILRTDRPLVVLEYEGWAWNRAGERLEPLLEWLAGFGYAVMTLQDSGLRRPLTAELAAGLPDHSDLVAAPEALPA
jgi:FkbM family methyltransferase